jgi:glutathione peroxidase
MPAPLFEIPLTRIDGSDGSLGDYAGSVLLVVNVASKCGLTPQYEGLESLYRIYRDQGFAVLGFPANDFKGQEPGSEAEIGEFCRSVYGVDFPMFAKIKVTGPDKHPLYKALLEAQPKAEFEESSTFPKHPPEERSAEEIHWNFEKFLIDRSGTVIRRFAPATEPQNKAVIAAIAMALRS